MRRLAMSSFILVIYGACLTAHQAAASEGSYYDIGNVHYKVTTSSSDAQLWFDRGLAM